MCGRFGNGGNEDRSILGWGTDGPTKTGRDSKAEGRRGFEQGLEERKKEGKDEREMKEPELLSNPLEKVR